MDDTRIGRFFSVDPMAKKYPYYSPYAFGGNNVIQFIEFEGLETRESGVTKFAIPAKSPIAPPAVALVGATLKSKPVVDITKQLANEALLKSVEGQGSQLLIRETTEEVTEGVAQKIAGGLAKTVGLVFTLLSDYMSPNYGGRTSEIIPQFSYKPLTEGIPATAPRISTLPENDSDNDDGVTLYRGVPRIIPNSNGIPNPAYIPATTGTAVPRGGIGATIDPIKANDGHASLFTFWTTDKEMAKDFATDWGDSDGILLTKKFPKSVLTNNPSPDKYNEGEVQILGVVKGALPEPVTPGN